MYSLTHPAYLMPQELEHQVIPNQYAVLSENIDHNIMRKLMHLPKSQISITCKVPALLARRGPFC